MRPTIERLSKSFFRLQPFPPMSRAHIQAFLGLRFHPAVENTPAREDEGVRALAIKNGQLKVKLERRAGYGLPHFGTLRAVPIAALT
jgi:hypothetical protein